MADQGWVDVNEAARLAGVSVATIRRRYRSGQVPSRLVDGRRLIDRAALIALSAPAQPQQSGTELALRDAVDQLGVMSHRLTEAVERAAKAEAENTFLKERLQELREKSELELSRVSSRRWWWQKG